MGSFSQLRLLIWKNFLVQKRQIVWSIFELFLPVAFSLILIILRQQVVSTSEGITSYKPYTVDGSCYDLFLQNVSGEHLFSLQFHPHKVFYAPKTPFIDNLMRNVADRFDCTFELPNTTAKTLEKVAEDLGFRIPERYKSKQLHYGIELKGFLDEETMVAELLNGLDASGRANQSYFGGIVFKNDEFSNGSLSNFRQPLKYAIRLPNIARNSLVHKSDNGRKTLGFDQTWDTKYSYPLLQNPGPREKFDESGGKPGYWREGFLTLQRAIDAEITAALEPDSKEYTRAVSLKLPQPPVIPKALVQLNRFPYPAYVDNPFITAVQRNLPLVLMISLALSVLYITRNVVQEKEKRLKEYMKAMGLSGWQHWIAHFVTNYLKVVVAVALITLFLKLPIKGKTVITETDGTVIFVFLLLYSACAVWFAFTVSVFFKKGNTAAGCGFVVWFFLYLPWFFIQPRYGDLSLGKKLASCLLLNTAMAFGAQVIGIYEGEGTGVQWSNIGTPGTIDDNFSMLHVFGMMIVDTVICVLITWYVEAIYPGDEGVPEKPWFPFLLSYWNPGYRARKVLVVSSDDDSLSTVTSAGQNVEPDPTDIEAVIELEGLTKTYGSIFSKKKVLAVNNLSIKMYPGQVTAILGHNGAGKSTTLSMLTGIIPPSSGTAKINGYDIRASLPTIRKQLGICPQYNSLFDHLTVEEHLELFCKLKDRLYMKTEVMRLLNVLGLKDKRDSLANTLSGGMKRKLLVAIALIGGSEIVMLDEPTSGMDPGARHEAWSLIQEEKEYRTILLTTHFMEEADLLGDRIAILARGQLQCCGTSFFLKGLYGAGYHITVVFDKNEQGSSRNKDSARSEAVLHVLHQHVPMAEMESSVGMEATFLLPTGQREKFEPMLHDLESNQKALGVASFGVSITTMEEVFLKVGKLADEKLSANTYWNPQIQDSSQPINDDLLSSSANQDNSIFGTSRSSISTTSGSVQKIAISSSNATTTTMNQSNASSDILLNVSKLRDFQPPYKNHGFILQFQQFYAMLVKRVIHSFRNILILVCQILIPIAIIAVALLINKTLPGPSPMPALALNLNPFGSNMVPVWNDTNFSSPLPIDSGLLVDMFSSVAVDADEFSGVQNVPNDSNITQFILKLYAELGTYSVNQKVIIGGAFGKGELFPEFDQVLLQHETRLVGFFNDKPLHGPPIALNLIDNTLLNYFRTRSNKSMLRIETINHPLPPSKADKLKDWLATGVQEFNIAFNIVFGMAFLSSSFIVFLVNERRTKAKHMQFLSGVHPTNFWLATFTWDFLNYMIPSLGILALFFAFDVKYLVYDGRWSVVLLILVLYGWAMLPMVYAFSFVFTSAPAAFVKVTIFKVFSGPVALTVTLVLYLVQLKDAYDKVEWVFLGLFPNFCLGQAFNEYYMNEFVKDQCKPFLQYCNVLESAICCPDQGALWASDSLQWESPGIGRMPFFLGVQGIFFWALIFIIEADLLRRVRYLFTNNTCKSVTKKKEPLENYGALSGGALDTKTHYDDDVEQERQRVTTYSHWDCTVLVKDLVKDYRSLRAVDHLNFSVKTGECFGLLGVNGAGKTSTFQMLTGENLISEGAAILDGVNVQKNWRKAGKNVGYCPQFDAVIDQLTGSETLAMFARLRGIPEGNISLIATAVINAVGIVKYKDRQVHTYSGGNKRRLSLGVALIGSPAVLLLDEPTTGVDPTARRAIWNVLSQIRHQGTALVLTSHSMEECEALCTRLAIMVAGKFRCLGSSQHLKGKFGAGYSLQVKIGDLASIPHAIRTLATTFPGSTLKEIHHTQLLYELPCMDNVSWSQLFGVLEKLLVPLKIVDYALSQTTLEQVFLGFSREVYGNKLGFDIDTSSSGELDTTDYI